MTTLTWNNNTHCYEADVEEGTLYVWRDAFAEARHDGNVQLVQERYPNAGDETVDAILETAEGDAIDDITWNELIDATTWTPNAQVFDYDPEGYTDCGDAWIVRKVNA